MMKLRIRNGPYSGRERTLAETPVTIGRDAEATIQILDRSASRFHAEVFPVGGMWFVRDLSSKNGTYVNNERLEDEELLREGDVIKIGNTELVAESGLALNDEDSNDRIAWQDDQDMLSNTLEFRIDDLSDIQDEGHGPSVGRESRSLQILYQVGRILGKDVDDGAIARVLDYLNSSMPAESALIFQRDRSSGRLVPQVVRSVSPRANPVISRTIIRRTVVENRAFFTANAMEDERIDRKDSAITKGIRSVVCVPLAAGGQVRGVLYLSRGPGETPFLQADMELLSACAVQMGLALQGIEAGRRHRQRLWTTLGIAARMLEGSRGGLGSGERAGLAAAALGRALKLAPHAIWTLQLAGVFRAMADAAGGPAAVEELATNIGAIDEFEEVAPVVRHARERLDGSGPLRVGDEQLSIETRILAVAVAFLEAVQRYPDIDALRIVDQLAGDPGLDREVVTALKSCHLDGSLYQPPAGVAP